MPKNSSLKSQTERYEQHDERVKQRPHIGFPLVSALCVDDRSVCTNVLLKAAENIVRRASNSKAIVYYLTTSRSIVVDREVSPIFVKLSKSLAWTRLKIQF